MRWAVLLLIPMLVDCSCGEDPQGTCVSASDCEPGQVCVSGQCSDPIMLDAGGNDTGVSDTGPRDTGATDTGVTDTGPNDTGAPDTGAPDTGNDDRDGDGIPDAEDNCIDIPNPGQEDSDLDGMGDACDPPTTFTTGGPNDPLCIYEPPPQMFAPAEEWRWLPDPATTPEPTKDQVMSTPVVINLTDDNGDGNVDASDTPDVVFISFDTTGPANDPLSHILQSGIVRAVSGADGSELWSATGAAREVAPASNLAAADLDGDGVPEIVAERWQGGVVALRANGDVYWECTGPTCAPITSFWGGLSIVDLDGGGPEVIKGGCVIEGTSGAVRFCGAGGHGSNGVGGIAVAVDLNGDNSLEVVAGNTAYNGTTGAVIWEYAARPDGFIAVGQMDGDSFPEFAMVGGGNVYRLDSDGSEVWSRPIRGGGAGGPPTIANFDADPDVEIGVVGRTRITVYDLDATMVWSNEISEFSSSRTGSSVFDFDGDGQAEVVYNDETTLFVYSFVGTASASVVWSRPNSTLTAHEYPVIADVDNDGNAEIIVGANDFARTGQRGLAVFGDVRDNWVPTRPIWNQHAYRITNVTVDGTVPYPEAASWLTTNTYRTNEQGTGSSGALAAPDLAAGQTAFIKRCPGRIDLGVWVENRGAIQAPAGVSVGFYDGPPSPANPAFAVGATSRTLAPGEAELVVVSWANPPASPRGVHAVVDDDGTGTGTGAHNECIEMAQNAAILSSQGCP